MNLDLIQPQVKAEIIHRINRLSPSSPALWGKMDVSQMMAHCNAQLRIALGDDKLPVSLTGKLFGSILKKFILRSKPFSRSLPTVPSLIIKTPCNFDEEKNKLLMLVKRFDANTLSKDPHPVFGKMTVEEWSKTTWKHTDHHLKQFGV